MIDGASLPVRLSIDNKYFSLDHRLFAKIGIDPVYLHSVATPLPNCIANVPVLALKHVVAG
jgi:hypothetical protein